MTTRRVLSRNKRGNAEAPALFIRGAEAVASVGSRYDPGYSPGTCLSRIPCRKRRFRIRM